MAAAAETNALFSFRWKPIWECFHMWMRELVTPRRGHEDAGAVAIWLPAAAWKQTSLSLRRQLAVNQHVAETYFLPLAARPARGSGRPTCSVGASAWRRAESDSKLSNHPHPRGKSDGNKRAGKEAGDVEAQAHWSSAERDTAQVWHPAADTPEKWPRGGEEGGSVYRNTSDF